MKKVDQARSISKKLSNLSMEMNVPYRSIAMSFYLERLLTRLIANRELKNKLVFKGGYVAFRAYNSQRFTIL